MASIVNNKKRYSSKSLLFIAGIALLAMFTGGYYFYDQLQPAPKRNYLLETSDPPSRLLGLTSTGDIKNVRLFLARYPDLVNLSKHYKHKGANPLNSAVVHGRPKILEFFLQQGMDVDHYYSGLVPLQTAISMDRCRPDIVEILIHYGANVNTWPPLPPEYASNEFNYEARHSHHRCSPLFVALFGESLNHLAPVSLKKLSIADVLIKHGADINKASPDGYSPLHYVVKNNLNLEPDGPQRLTFARYLLSKPTIDVNVTSAVEHKTPLHFLLFDCCYTEYTTREQKLELLKLLIEHGARTDIKDYKGHTVIDYLKKHNNRNREILAILAKAKNPPLVKEVRD